MGHIRLIRELVAEIRRLRQTILAMENEQAEGSYNASYYAERQAEMARKAESRARAAEEQAKRAQYDHEQYTDLMRRANNAAGQGDDWGADRLRRQAKWYE
ncbi:MAG: hypothetical protein WCF84_07515 [Anaerolineae bacterium]